LQALPDYVVKWRFLYRYGFITGDRNGYAIKVKKLEHMRHPAREHSIRLQILCESFTAHLNNFLPEE